MKRQVVLLMTFLFHLLPTKVYTTVCIGGQADIVFLLDSSASLGEGHFEIIKGFTHNLTLALDVKTDAVQIGVIKFNWDANHEILLDDYSDGETLREAINNITYTLGLTYIDKALRLLREEAFTSENGGRGRAVPKIGIVITDGNSTDATSTWEQSSLAKADNITLFAIGIGQTNNEELREIATDPDEDYVYHVTDFSDLQTVEDEITERACKVAKGKPCQTYICRILSGLEGDRDNGASARRGTLTYIVIFSVIFLVLLESNGISM